MASALSVAASNPVAIPSPPSILCPHGIDHYTVCDLYQRRPCTFSFFFILRRVSLTRQCPVLPLPFSPVSFHPPLPPHLFLPPTQWHFCLCAWDLALPLDNPSPPAGGACYGCAAFFTPPQYRCPHCGSHAILLLPGPPAALLAAGNELAVRLRRYPGLHTLQLLPSPVNYLVLHTLRQWLQDLHQHQRRRSPCCFPSVPMLSTGHTLTVWNTIDPALLRLLPPDALWTYTDLGTHQQLDTISPADHPAPQTWLWAENCPLCGRPQPLRGLLLPSGTPSASPAGSCCWLTPDDTPITSDAAARSTVVLGHQPLHGVLPTSFLRRYQCTPPELPPFGIPGAPPYQPHFPTAPPSTPPASVSLRVLSANCGGAASKLPRLVALLLHADPDIACLQEAGAITTDMLRGLPYRSVHSTPIRGGGLITLIHHRRLTHAVASRCPFGV